MSTQTIIVTLVPSAIAAIIAVTVPWVAFRWALRQDRIRRLYEQRAQLYVDILTEAYAERVWFDFENADEEVQQRMRAYTHDLRLPRLERARLGARASIFASPTVNRLSNEVQGYLARASLTGKPSQAELIATRVNVAGAFERLEQAVRREMGADSTEA